MDVVRAVPDAIRVVPRGSRRTRTSASSSGGGPSASSTALTVLHLMPDLPSHVIPESVPSTIAPPPSACVRPQLDMRAAARPVAPGRHELAACRGLYRLVHVTDAHGLCRTRADRRRRRAPAVREPRAATAHLVLRVRRADDVRDVRLVATRGRSVLARDIVRLDIGPPAERHADRALRRRRAAPPRRRCGIAHRPRWRGSTRRRGA